MEAFSGSGEGNYELAGERVWGSICDSGMEAFSCSGEEHSYELTGANSLFQIIVCSIYLTSSLITYFIQKNYANIVKFKLFLKNLY